MNSKEKITGLLHPLPSHNFERATFPKVELFRQSLTLALGSIKENYLLGKSRVTITADASGDESAGDEKAAKKSISPSKLQARKSLVPNRKASARLLQSLSGVQESYFSVFRMYFFYHYCFFLRPKVPGKSKHVGMRFGKGNAALENATL